MEKKADELQTDDWLKDLPLRSDSEGYRSSEMIPCKKCQRKNPPNRLQCMYCGVELEFNETQSQLLKPILRKVEPHKKGFNLIYLANLNDWDEHHLEEVAKMTRLEVNDLRKISKSQKPLPIARGETLKETEIVSERLNEIGIETKIMSDKDFEIESVPRRLRGIEFQDDVIIFILFNNDEIARIKKEDINLIVVGAVFERKLESTEKYKKKGENKVLETTEISSDEILIDIYKKDDLISYRIAPKGFDFSCLGSDKKMLASENIQILINKLDSFLPNANLDKEYLTVRDSLTQIWDTEEKNDSKGMKRKSFGSYNRLSVITTNNLTQFTKYSRLQWLLKK